MVGVQAHKVPLSPLGHPVLGSITQGGANPRLREKCGLQKPFPGWPSLFLFVALSPTGTSGTGHHFLPNLSWVPCYLSLSREECFLGAGSVCPTHCCGVVLVFPCCETNRLQRAASPLLPSAPGFSLLLQTPPLCFPLLQAPPLCSPLLWLPRGPPPTAGFLPPIPDP